MAQSNETLPEGTDSIVTGASVEGEAGDGFALGHGELAADPPVAPSLGQAAAGIKTDAVRAVGEKTAGIREQAGDKARAYALQGKEKATDALDNVVKLVGDAAGQVDDKLGEQYGDYVRRAGDAISGIATQLRDKDVDELVDDARGVIRQSPTIAIGAAAAVGFLVARVVKAGLTSPAESDTPADRRPA